MRFIFSEAELCPENEYNKEIIHDGLVKHCVDLLQPSESSKTPEDSSIRERTFLLQKNLTLFFKKCQAQSYWSSGHINGNGVGSKLTITICFFLKDILMHVEHTVVRLKSEDV